MYLQVQAGGVDTETEKNHDFLSGAFMYLQVQTGGVDAETGKTLTFFRGFICRCRQAAWTQRPEKTIFPCTTVTGASPGLSIWLRYRVGTQ
jgi:hypothetical protein